MGIFFKLQAASTSLTSLYPNWNIQPQNSISPPPIMEEMESI